MTTLACRADKPGPLALNAEEDLARSAAIVQAAGYQLVPLRHSIGPWGLLGTCSQGLLLVAIVREDWAVYNGRALGPPGQLPGEHAPADPLLEGRRRAARSAEPLRPHAPMEVTV